MNTILFRQLFLRLRFGNQQRFARQRKELAYQFLQGSGIEIGALHNPLPLPLKAQAQYVDRLDAQGLRTHYPELKSQTLVKVDLVDDGEKLEKFSSSSLDFVISNHLLEHCQNPLSSITNWLRVLRKNGILFLAVPDKRYTFDYRRPITKLEHIIRDLNEGPEWSRMLHYEEWARLVDRVPKKSLSRRASELSTTNYSIHFHVWTKKELQELFKFCKDELQYKFETRLIQENGIETILILERI